MADPWALQSTTDGPHTISWRASFFYGYSGAATLTDVPVERGSISFDRDRAPHVTAWIEIPSAYYMAHQGVSMTLNASYVDETGKSWERQVVRLWLRRAELVWPGDIVRYEATSVETDIMNAHGVKDAATLADGGLKVFMGTTYYDALVMLCYHANIAPTYTDATGAGLGMDKTIATPEEFVVTDLWGTMEDLADRIGADIWSTNGMDLQIGVWPARPHSQSYARLRTGPGGSLIAVRQVSDANELYASRVLLVHEWTTRDPVTNDITPHVISAFKSDTTVQFNERRAVEIRRSTPITQSHADSIADSILSRMRRRNSQIEAVAPLMAWIRPGHTVSITLPTGVESRLLVWSAEYDISNSTMRLSCRN